MCAGGAAAPIAPIDVLLRFAHGSGASLTRARR